MLSFRRFILIHNLWLVKISYFKCFIYFIQKQVEAFTVHLRLRFFFWRQIYKLYQSSDYIAESKFPLFIELAFIEKLKFLSSFFFHLNPCQKLIFPPKNLEKNTGAWNTHAPICYLKLCKLHLFKMIQFSRQKT